MSGASSPPPLVARLFGLLGAAMLVGAVIWSVRTYSLVSRAFRADGTIVDVRVSGGEAPAYTWVVSFRDAAGAPRVFTTNVAHSWHAYRVGDGVPVLFAPPNALGQTIGPKLDSFVELWYFPILLGLMGLSFLLVGVGAPNIATACVVVAFQLWGIGGLVASTLQSPAP